MDPWSINPSQIAFRETAFQGLALVYFALFVAWLSAAGRKIAFPTLAVGLFVGLGYAALCVSDWGLSGIGTALAIGLGLALAIASSEVAPSFFASLLFLRPWELAVNDSYAGLLPRLSFVICLGHLGLSAARGRKIDWRPGSMGLLLIGFTIWCFASTFFAPDPGASQSEYFNDFIKSIFLYFILVQSVRDRTSLRLLETTLLLAFLFVGAACVYQTFAFPPPPELADGDQRLQGFGAFTNSNDVAALMVFILPFGWAAATRKAAAFPLRLAGMSLTLLSFGAIILSKSRGAMVAVAAVIATRFFLRKGKRALVPVIAVLIAMAVPASILVSGRGREDLEGSSAGRITYLKAGLRMGVKNPAFGVGFDAFPVSLAQYSTESLEEDPHMTAHNSWVLVFAETGVIGLLLFSAAFARAVRSAWITRSRNPEFFLTTVGYGVAMIFLSHSYLIYPYLLYALVEIARRLEEGEERNHLALRRDA